MPSNIFFLILAILIFVMVLLLVRNQKMKEKYAAFWLVISAVIIVVALFPSLLTWLADITGVVVPVNLLFLLAIIMLIGVTMHLTLEVSKISDETRTLAEEVAILRSQMEQGNSKRYNRKPNLSQNPSTTSSKTLDTE